MDKRASYSEKTSMYSDASSLTFLDDDENEDDLFDTPVPKYYYEAQLVDELESSSNGKSCARHKK